MRRYFSLTVVLLLLCSNLAHAQYLGWDAQEQARTHTTDISHIEMHITFDQPAKKVIGTVLHTLTILPQQQPVHDITFDAADLTIQRVWLVDQKGKQTPLTFDTSEAQKLRILFSHDMPFDSPFTIGIEYFGFPKKGMYFIRPDTFYTTRPEQIWTQGEGEDNHYWLPTYDYPNDKTTTDMFVTVRADQKALSNGHLIGKDKNKDGSVTWHWQEDHPYSTYLIMLGIGDYRVPTDKWRGKDVEYWVYPAWEKDAERIFGLTPKMLEFFSTKTGFPYAWEKYSQIAIADFMYGGMENVSATTLNDYVLFDKRSGIDFSSEGLIAHELAHQWFGDVVTCRSWIHMWLNESFATYFEAMFREYNDGKDEFDEEMQSNQNSAISAEASLGKKPIVAANNYTANQYPRGSTVLNMLRHILGDDGFWKSINHYLTVHQFQPVVTEDLKMAIEEATGQNLQWFFDEWLYKDGHPMFSVDYNYEPDNHVLRLHVTQTQPRDNMTGTFRMPIDVELTMPDGSTKMETIRLEDSTQNFAIVSSERPAMVIFDKGNTTLKEVTIAKSPTEWVYQLTHAKLAIERSEAAQNLASETSSTEAFDALKNTALHDPFWATRNYALMALAHFADSNRSIQDVILAAFNDSKSDVRATAADMAGRFVDRAMTPGLLERLIAHDSSYKVDGIALRSLYKYDPQRAYSIAESFLTTQSPRDRMRQSAIDVLSMTKTESSLHELISLLGQHDIPRWTRWNLVAAIGAMHNVDSALVFRTLWNVGNNGDMTVRGTGLNRLADYGDEATYRQLLAQAATRPEMKPTYDALLARMRKRLGIPDPDSK